MQSTFILGKFSTGGCQVNCRGECPGEMSRGNTCMFEPSGTPRYSQCKANAIRSLTGKTAKHILCNSSTEIY